MLYRYDPNEGALLMERLGRPMYELGLPLARRLEILCATAARIWRPAPDCGLPTGADKARWLADFIVTSWEELGRPCSEKAVDHALACAVRRARAHRDERAVLVHGLRKLSPELAQLVRTDVAVRCLERLADVTRDCVRARIAIESWFYWAGRVMSWLS